MKYWTKILTLLNIIDKGSIAKPYNSFVVRNFFTPLAQHLNLISEDNRKYSLTPNGKQYLKNLEEIRKQDIVATMPGEYTILAGIADILYDAKTTHIASPWINHELVKIVEKHRKTKPTTQTNTPNNKTNNKKQENNTTTQKRSRNLSQNIPGITINYTTCLLYTSPSPRDLSTSRMPSSA